MKKPPLKVAHNWPKVIFFNTGPAAQMAQKQKSRTTKSPLMQDWVFRLGKSRFNQICLLLRYFLIMLFNHFYRQTQMLWTENSELKTVRLNVIFLLSLSTFMPR